MRARFVRLEWENESRTIGTVYVKPDKPYYFTAGQYTDLTIPHAPADNRGISRTMTIVTRPSDALVGITCRFDSPSLSTYKRAILGLEPNAEVSLTDAMGDLILPLDASIPLVFVAGGVGIASYVSMVRWLVERKDRRNITLLYTVRDTSDVIFQKDFDGVSSVGTVRRILFTTDNKVDTVSWNGSVKKSRLTAADIVSASATDSQVFISGSQSMVESLYAELTSTYDIPQYKIAHDYFEGYKQT